MKKTELIKQLELFIETYSVFVGSKENVFTPTKEISINYWIDGVFEILVKHEEIEINFNSISTGIIVFAFRENQNYRVIRVLMSKIIAFELITENGFDEELLYILKLKKEQNN